MQHGINLSHIAVPGTKLPSIAILESSGANIVISAYRMAEFPGCFSLKEIMVL